MPSIYDFKRVESEMLKFWEAKAVYPKLKKRNSKGKPWYFLQGPPYTSGRIHIGTAWNNCLKDSMLRFKRFQGFDVWDRAGYDMHGLPTENAVAKLLKLHTKEEIEKYGVEKFVKKCLEFGMANAVQMNKDFWKLGCWLDWENAYMPVKNDFIEGEWWLVKKAWQDKRLYKGKKAMTWCKNCETGLAKHELEYETIRDDSIFLKFEVVGKKNEYLIIWTTTPWTIPYNLAVMANPELDYIHAKVDNEVWILAEALAPGVIGTVAGKQYKVLEKFKGEKLKGLKYRHPLHDEIPFFKQNSELKKLHTVVLCKEYVDAGSGSGLVHCAPGCGPEDFEVGQREGLPPFNNLDERGVFLDMGKYTGWTAKDDDRKFIDELRKTGMLIEVTKVEHEYAHCWRCHRHVIYRTTEQWFLKTEDLKEKIKKANAQVLWVPSRGKQAFDDWIDSLRDNSITRQRYWGCPVPIWECSSCGKVTVIGSIAELKKVAVTKIPADLHKPWIDVVKVKCTCGKTASRIPDVIDVWIDSATTSWNCLYYPQRTDYFKKYFPADFILEATEQVRLWFYMLQLASVLAFGKGCYKSVYMHGMILDWQGMKMSKSLGNIVSPDEVLQKTGIDLFRYYMAGNTAGENMNFSFDELETKRKNLLVLWNLHNWVIDIAKDAGVNPEKLTAKDVQLQIEEKYMLSFLNSKIKEVAEEFENIRLDKIPVLCEQLWLELSRNYIQLVREKASVGSDVERKACLYTAYKTLTDCTTMFSTIAPFVCEQMFQNFRKEFKIAEESVFFRQWPRHDMKHVDAKLEQKMQAAKKAMTAILAVREKAGIGLKWPLPSAAVEIKTDVKLLLPLMERQCNIKKVELKAVKEAENVAEFEGGKVAVDTRMTEELETEGFSREIMRKVQSLRKQMGLEKRDSIQLHIATKELSARLQSWKEKIAEKCGCKKIEISAEKPSGKWKQSAKEKIRGKEVEIFIY